jgi:RHS repeat-associated protein
LAIQINGTWYTYGWDLTKNICELYSTGGTLTTAYTYSPFGKVTASGSLTQPIQWSSEVWDDELGLVYYNWRYYNAKAGRWGARDKDDGLNLYMYVNNNNYLIDVVGLSDIQRYVLFNRYKENEEYMFINNDIATFTHVPEKNYKYPTEYFWIGAENMLKDEINKRNAASKDLQGRQCYQIDIYEKALTLHGLYSLPWEGYDKAILITHSMYINEIVSYYDTGIYLPDSRQSIKVQIGAPNVEVFGCHLSHEVGGKLEYRREVLPLLFQYLDQLKYRDCCEKIIYIQIVSNFRNHDDKIRVSNI